MKIVLKLFWVDIIAMPLTVCLYSEGDKCGYNNKTENIVVFVLAGVV